MENKELIMFKTKDGKLSIDVNLNEETVWLSQKKIAELFDKNVKTINEHIKNVFKEGELEENSVIRNFRITASDGKSYDTMFYNLDVIISVGYRVKSKRGTEFRIWANSILKDYLMKGYALDERRFEKDQVEQEIEESRIENERTLLRAQAETERERLQARIAEETQRKDLVNTQMENRQKEADAEAYAVSTKMNAFKQLPVEHLKAIALAQMQPEQLMALAFEGLAQNASKIGELNITPDLFGQMVKKAVR